MDAILLWIFGVLVVLFWRWPQRNHLGANMKGSVVLDLEGLESFCVSRDVSDLASALNVLAEGIIIN